jgi:hypothetical protein
VSLYINPLKPSLLTKRKYVFFVYFFHSFIKHIMTKVCYEISSGYTWTLCSSQEQTHTFEIILSRSGEDNRGKQARDKGESSLRNYLNAGCFYITPCGPLSVCCTICFCCLDLRYGNIPKKLKTIILQ